MSSRYEFDERSRPVILGGPPVARATGTVDWRFDGAKAVPRILPLPEESDLIYPEGLPVTTRPFAFGLDAKSREGVAFAVPNARVGLDIAIRAALIKRAREQGRALAQAPAVVTSAWSFPELFTSLRGAGLRLLPAEVNPSTGCPTQQAVEAVADTDTGLVALPAMHDQVPNLAAIRRTCDQRGWPLVIAVAQMPAPLWDGLPAVTYADIAVVEGQSSAEMGARVVTYDRRVADIVAEVAARLGTRAPLVKLVTPNTLHGNLTYEFRHRDRLATLRQYLTRHRELPWNMLPEPTGVDGGVHRVGLVFDPSTSDKPDEWNAIGRKKAGGCSPSR